MKGVRVRLTKINQAIGFRKDHTQNPTAKQMSNAAPADIGPIGFSPILDYIMRTASEEGLLEDEECAESAAESRSTRKRAQNRMR